VTTDNNNSHKNANSNRRRNKFTTNNNNNNNYVTQFAHDSSSFDSPWIIRSKMDTYKDEPVFDPEMYNVPERGYPKMTHLLDYATSAVELEIEKHDRILVQGMHFMTNHDFHPLGQFIQQHSPHVKKNVCLNIYLCNRRVPYINSLIMSLVAYSSNETQMDLLQAQIHLLNTEKRNDRLDFKYLRDKLSKLPFVHKVHNITYRDEIYANITDRELTFREMFISDEISGLKICIESGLAYCIMMEEDAIVPVDFMTLLNQQVIEPLEREGIIHVDGTGSISVLSLYSYYNLVVKGSNRLHYPEYTKQRYYHDAAKLNSERYSRTMPPFERQYKISEKDYMYGTVAMMYTRESAKKLIEFLQRVGVDPIHNADEFMNANEYFPTEMGIPRKHVHPSLVNHIGYYSERMADLKERGMFSQLNTDSRFMFDAGEL
jgi:GR25 family glycosyltransferase involved in LPS biosynthesis